MKIYPVEAELLHVDRTMDRWTDRSADRDEKSNSRFSEF
jgi:hypothetical protein